MARDPDIRRRDTRKTAPPARARGGFAALVAVVVLAAMAFAALLPRDMADAMAEGGRDMAGRLAEVARAAEGAVPAIPDRIAEGEMVNPDRIRVVDGDTFRIGSERVRIEGIDTPEMNDGAECEDERRLADRATARARTLIAAAHEIRIRRTGVDQYDRTLARIWVDGRDFNDVLIAEGLAVRWAGRQHDWCR